MDEMRFKSEAETLSPALYRAAVSILRSPHDAQDAVQEALLKAWAACERCREETFPSYLMHILINECRNIQRARMRQIPVEALPEEAAPQQSANPGLKNALDSLPDNLRTPLLLHYMEGWSGKMIAKSLGITAMAVRRRLYRARKSLKVILDMEGGDS